MKTIAFVPARCGSKAIPLKNIKEFCGKPLIYWVLAALEKVKQINEIYVATDCSEIKNIVAKFNFPKLKIYIRDPKNARDHSSTESVMSEFIRKKRLNDNDVFILAQATAPLTKTADFIQALDLYYRKKADSLLSCARVKHFFWYETGKPVNYDYRKRPRRQDFKGILMENGAIYINTVGNIKKYKNRLSGNICIYEMPSYAAVDIDEPDDWIVAENLMRKCIFSKEEKKIKLFVTDVDGVLTDAGMYYSDNGEELKKFNTRDGRGIELLRKSGIKAAIITSENTRIVERRAKKIEIDYVFQGITDKMGTLKKLCAKLRISLKEVAYIGDDINDLAVLKNVGASACPSDAMDKVKEVSQYVCNLKGGQGCVREFIDKIILMLC